MFHHLRYCLLHLALKEDAKMVFLALLKSFYLLNFESLFYIFSREYSCSMN